MTAHQLAGKAASEAQAQALTNGGQPEQPDDTPHEASIPVLSTICQSRLLGCLLLGVVWLRQAFLYIAAYMHCSLLVLVLVQVCMVPKAFAHRYELLL